MLKQEIRKKYLQIRKRLSEQERTGLEQKIAAQFNLLPLPHNVNYIMSYMPMEKLAELPPKQLEDFLLLQFPDAALCYPKVLEHEMEAISSQKNVAFAKNKYGTYEIVNGVVIAPNEIDIVIVPLLALDKNGNRVGYGKGYYDKYLQKCKTDVITIGLSYFDAIEIIDDTSDTDISLQYAITPERVYRF